MPLPERGESYLKTIIFLAFVAALVFTAVKVFPVYFSNYQLSDYIRDRAVQAAVNRTSTEIVQTLTCFSEPGGRGACACRSGGPS